MEYCYQSSEERKGGFTHNNNEAAQEFTQTLPEQDVPDS